MRKKIIVSSIIFMVVLLLIGAGYLFSTKPISVDLSDFIVYEGEYQYKGISAGSTEDDALKGFSGIWNDFISWGTSENGITTYILEKEIILN